MATIILIDPHTGAPQSIMDGTWITAYRTAAASAIATKYLANKNTETIGIIGAGMQALPHLKALTYVKKIKTVKIWDTVEANKERLVSEIKSQFSDLNVTSAKSLPEAIRGVDVLITLTPSRKPYVKSEWVSAGTHINAMGADAPGKEELMPDLLKKAKIVIDDWEQASHSGEINVPLKEKVISKDDIYAEIGDVVTGNKQVRTSNDDITIFDSTGLAIQDAVTAKLVYNNALKSGLGLNIENFTTG